MYQDDLDRFLTIGQRFKLQGLLGSSPSKEVTEDYKVVDVPDLKVEIQEGDMRKITSSPDKIEDVTNEKVTFPISAENIDDIEEKISEFLEKMDSGNFRCTLCGKESNRSRNVKNHIETHMEGLSFPCERCGRSFRSRIGLYNHSLSHKA